MNELSSRYQVIKTFIDNHMSKESHYTVVMLLELLKQAPGFNAVHKHEIARALAVYDNKQLQHYESLVRRLPAHELRQHGLIDSGPKGSGLYLLNDASELSSNERNDLAQHCESYLSQILAKRESPDQDNTSGNSEEVTEEFNPQQQASRCIFCNLSEELSILDENQHCFLIKDKHPVSAGHCLVIPKRHVVSYFDMSPAEFTDANQLLLARQKLLLEYDASITGFNSGTNCGESAGQTIFHAHIHLIPRRDGDQSNPRGGIRKIFPHKADY